MPDLMPPTAYHTAITMLARALLLPAQEQVPFVNQVARLAWNAPDDQQIKQWLALRAKMHGAVRKCSAIAQELAALFEEFELQNPALVEQLELFPMASAVPLMTPPSREVAP